jgi:hypothetical protein
MPMDRTLSEFQKSCLRELERVLAPLSRQIMEPRLLGEHETYLQTRVADSDIEIFIYEDEATFSVSGTHRMYERCDYRSPDDLIDAFVKGVLEFLEREAGR